MILEQVNSYMMASPRPRQTIVEPLHDAVATLKALIGFNTTTSDRADLTKDTRAATEYVGQYLAEQTGAKIYFTEPYEYPAGSGKFHKGLVAVWHPARPSSKPPLAFSAHIDTVPALEPWDGHDPFQGREEGEKVIGRGALDIKGQTASLMATLKSMQASGQLTQLDRPLVFMLSSCEEVGLLGAKGVCDLTKKLVGEPSEVIVMEPTDGYIGIGCKGTRQTDLRFENKYPLPPSSQPYRHYLTIEIGSGSGHSSLQAASPADPAIMATKVLERVKKLREKEGIPAEICAVDYGVAGNVVGGKATIIVGYDAPPEDPQGTATYEKVRRRFENVEQPLANFTLRGFTHLGNMMNYMKNQVRGLDLGTVNIAVTRPTGAQHEEPPCYPRTLTTERGRPVPHNAIEHALEVTAAIYREHAQQRGKGAPAHCAIPLLGVTKLSVPMLKGDARDTRLSYDVRYPPEAAKGDQARNVDAMDSVIRNIDYIAKWNNDIRYTVERAFDAPPYLSATPDDPRLQPYLAIGKQTGFTKFASSATLVPYSSDGNVIAQEMPNALVLTMARGGFAQMPHGKGEHLTRQHMSDNINLFGQIVQLQCMAKGHGAAASRQR